MNRALRLANSLDTIKVGQNRRAADAWADHFGVAINTPIFFRAISVVIQNATELQQELSNSGLSEKAKGLYIGATHRLWPYFNPEQFYNANTDQLNQSNDAIDLLHLAADALPAAAEPNPIAISAVIEEVSELREMIAKLDAEPKLKAFLLAQVDTLLVALRSFDTIGVEGLSIIYGSVASEVARAGGQTVGMPKQTISAISKFVKVLKKVGAGIIFTGAVVGGAHEMLTNGTELLGLIAPDDAISSTPAIKKLPRS